MQHKTIRPDAIAVICGSDDYPNLRGQVRFYQRRNCILVEASIRGLPTTETGFFGFHIHTGRICAEPDFSASGNHYNPTDAPHPLHAGDLPPLISCCSEAYMAVTTGRFRLTDIIGRTVIVHDMVDDFHTQPSGNAGRKIACGVIRRV